jgi:hypothetical protein
MTREYFEDAVHKMAIGKPVLVPTKRNEDKLVWNGLCFTYTIPKRPRSSIRARRSKV